MLLLLDDAGDDDDTPSIAHHFSTALIRSCFSVWNRGRGLVSFSELVHLDVWLNSPQAALEVALRLAGRDAGFEALTLADWAALREAARRDMGGSKEEEEEEGEDARFVARTFGGGAGRRRGGRGQGLLASFRKMSGAGGGEAEVASLEDVSASVPYDDFVRALQSSGAWRGVSTNWRRGRDDMMPGCTLGWFAVHAPTII